MTSVQAHYEGHLAPLYAWLQGGEDQAFNRGQRELAEIGLSTNRAGYAVDLGAGFGMHTIPLARAGWKVLAIDGSAILLDQLRTHADSERVATVQDDLLRFPQHLSGRPDLILCMGDTLTHLSDAATVQSLFSSASEHLPPGGRLVLSFRDYTNALEGVERFIPVNADETRIASCLLEYAEDTVRVTDILHERSEGRWRMRVSAYRKLRLAPDWVLRELDGHGFAAKPEAGLAGMMRVVAVRR